MTDDGSIKERLLKMPDRISGLAEIAYNLWWSWHPGARMLFKMLNRIVWKESGHNPVQMLRDFPPDILKTFADNPEYLRHYDVVLSKFRNDIKTKVCWFAANFPAPGCLPIAYFSAEYGLHHSLPFYAGGLGFLAGDYIKECSDLGVPMVAVGFMYPEGYLRQIIRMDGWQEDVDETLDRDATPIERVLDEKGDQLIVKVPFVDPPIYVAVWKVDVGRIPLYLMDTDIQINDPWNRRVSAHLYIGDIEQRLRQEIILGIGGIAVLNALGVKHSVIHLNEGHSAFAILERIRERIEEGKTFEEALELVRSTTVFTTHTPMPAGHDVFPFHLMDKYFSRCYPLLGLSREAFFQLGIDPKEPEAGFNVTAFSIRMSRYVNAVSTRHGEVTRRMWQSLWPDKKEEEAPIDEITNGIHLLTWIEPKMKMLFHKYLGSTWVEDHDNPVTWGLIDDIPDQELWQVHYWLKIKLINFIREQARRRWTENRVTPVNVITGGILLDPTTLTIGFARRFTSYKRADLIFNNLERLKRILKDRWRPVQIIFAGKAHPADDEGKRILQRIYNFAHDQEMGGRIAFVENYDEQLGQYMVHGVDLWLNNPLPPMEACGTSGMKASLNGVPHLSVLDGWWIEGYNGKNGWAFEGKGDEQDAAAIYDLLEKEIVPLFYKLDESGTPAAWVRVMKEAVKSTAAQFSARRMVKEYALKFYQHAMKATGK
ncbi:MAG: alpha-glucan family phosphorylase [Thermodesulfovibrionales bacterium]